MNKLSDLLVLCAPHGVPSHNCYEFLTALWQAGATVQMMQATSDAALTRNNQAALAVQTLKSQTPFEWMLWVDHDMSAPIDSVLLLMGIAQALKDGGLVPSVSGSYVNRHDELGRRELAAFALKDAVERIVTLPPRFCVVDPAEQDPEPLHLRCVPALAGMGCLLQHRTTFLNHFEGSILFNYPNNEHWVPAMCQAHLAHASELAQWLDVNPNVDMMYWVAEDFDYCIRELELGSLVYVAPVVFGHDKLIRMVADSNTVFPGLRAPAEQVD